jgi:aminoglycoside 3-N-acetyltransferase
MIKEGKKTVVSLQDINRSLQELNIKKGDIVGVHSSLGSIGYVSGGAETVIDGLLDAVGEKGTVVMPTYSSNRVAVEKTEEDMSMGVSWKYKILPYNPQETPCWTGKIPDTFWRRKEAVRSSHPTHSLAAIGKDAMYICEGWKRLLEADGYILLIGVGLRNCSSLHLAEEYVELPQYILEKTVPPKELVEKYPKSEWDIGYGAYPDFSKMEEVCKRHGVIKTTTIGEAVIKFVKLRDLIELYAGELKKNPHVFYKETAIPSWIE